MIKIDLTYLLIALLFLVMLGIIAGYAMARPGDRLTCERDYTGTCAEPEPPKDPCGGQR